jgi:hypothetical protein
MQPTQSVAAKLNLKRSVKVTINIKVIKLAEMAD